MQAETATTNAPDPGDPSYTTYVPEGDAWPGGTDRWLGQKLGPGTWIKEVLIPAIASIWFWAKLFHVRTIDLDKRVKDLEREVASLKEALAAVQTVQPRATVRPARYRT